MPRGQFVDIIERLTESHIQHKIAAYPKIMIALLEMAVVGEDVCLCHREDQHYHEDVPDTHYYYLELSQQQFLAMGGEEL